MRPLHRNYEYLALATILFVAVAMRLFTLDSANIWHDESFTAKFYEERAWQIKNSLIYILILISQTLFGESESMLRLPSFLFGVGAIGLIFVLGKEFRSRSVGLLSAAFLTLLPWHLFHSQYARYYAAVVFFTVLLHLFFLRALRRNSIAYLLAAGVAALLAISAHLTAILAPLGLWIVCVVLYFGYTRFGEGLSRRIIGIGFWMGVVCAVIMTPLLIDQLASWTESPGQFIRSPAQQIFQYYNEVGVLILLAFFAFLTERNSEHDFDSAYLGISIAIPIAVIIGATLFTSIRGDYGICFVVPAVLAAAIAVDSVWSYPKFGKKLSVLLVLLFVADASPRLLSHYTDRLARYSINASEFLQQQIRPGDRVASFVPGVRFYLEEESVMVERDGLGSPYAAADSWPLIRLAPENERLWLAFSITRDDLSPPVLRWLRKNNAKIVWRQVSPRLDSQVRGVEIFLVCPPSMQKCDNAQEQETI